MPDQPTQEDSIVAALRRIVRGIDVHSRELLQRCGLTTPQLLTMRALVRMEPVAVTVLAGAVSVSQATMTGILDRLEQQCFVARSRGQGDRRNTLVRSTESGRQFIASAPSVLQDRFRSELHSLARWEQTAMLATLEHIAAMMGVEELTASPILTSGAEGLLDPDPLTSNHACDSACGAER
jgi:DNA-binding MarR family transcriptional regulator